MKKDNNQKKSKAGIYLWKLIVIITAIFAIVLSTECFFLIEKTVKDIVRGSLEEHNTSMVIETEETPAESDDIENKDESSIERFDSTQTETDNTGSENDNPAINDSTNTTTDTPTNTIEEEESTNTTQTNPETNMVTENTVDTNTVNSNDIDSDEEFDETEEDNDFKLEEKLVCKKIHEHLKICYLEQYTEEDRESVFLVIQMIDELPESKDISERLQALEEAENDEGYAEYYSKIAEQVKHIYSYYVALKSNEKDLRSYVTNSDKLLSLYNICGINNISLSSLTEVNVQYYAYIDRIKRGAEISNYGNDINAYKNNLDEGILALIDTSAEKNGGNPFLPQNARGLANTPVKAKIQSISTDTDGTIQYIDDELTEIYRSVTRDIEGRTYVDKLNRFDDRDNNYYALSEIWLQRNSENPDSVDRNDWEVFSTVDIANGMYFTDDDTDENPTAVLVNNGSTIRYVCTADNGEYDNACTFFDYDITNGGIYRNRLNADAGTDTGKESTSTQKNTTKYYVHSYQSGINHPDNYNNDTKTNFNSRGEIAKLAFGNANTNSGLSEEVWVQWDARAQMFIRNGINRANMPNVTGNNNSSYQIATYGLTTGLDSDENIQYAPGINAPNLFSSETEVHGKTEYADRFDLRFARNGDTYVLNSVTDNTKTQNEGKILENLNKIVHPQAKYKWIYTNNFWPMDHVDSFGGDNHDLKYGSTTYKNYRYLSILNKDEEKALGESDDGLDHNSFFGMYLSLEFNMVEDYVGPLEYYFFGDDDLWVFLDGELVCDLGGVHTAVGEYTNLWDYMDESDIGKSHTLTIYYTERGAAGSTCWMHFNLPHPLAEATPSSQRGDLVIKKDVINVDTDDRFIFSIELKDKDGEPLPRRYDYITSSGRSGGIMNGEVFFLYAGEEITIKGIPMNSTYSVQEIEAVSHTAAGEAEFPLEHYVTASEGTTGKIVARQKVYAKFTNAYNHTFAKVEKVWDDDNNSSRVRPEQVKVTLSAKTQNGVDCTDYVKSLKPEVQFEAILSEANEWKYEWQDLPKYKLSTNGSEVTATDEIIYTVDEEQTDELKENYFVLSKVQRNNTTIITNASYKNIILTKVDTEDEAKTLAGAQFKIEKLLKDDDDTDMTIDTTFTPIISEITGEDGKFSFEKLRFGRYQITEIKTPEGYNTIKKPIVINVRQNTIKLTNPTSLLEQITEFETDGKLLVDLGKIGNRKGITLTETGGTGTKIFTIAGLAIIVISLSLLKPKQKISLSESARQRRKKRMSQKDK